jgi:hypothetical protein
MVHHPKGHPASLTQLWEALESTWTSISVERFPHLVESTWTSISVERFPHLVESTWSSIPVERFPHLVESTWSSIPVERFPHLVESMPQRLEAVLKRGEGCNAMKMFLMFCPLRVSHPFNESRLQVGWWRECVCLTDYKSVDGESVSVWLTTSRLMERVCLSNLQLIYNLSTIHLEIPQTEQRVLGTFWKYSDPLTFSTFCLRYSFILKMD